MYFVPFMPVFVLATLIVGFAVLQIRERSR
jgi:hypothetical protein